MDSPSHYSPFIEHSFRRLTLLIHQQDALDTNVSISSNKTIEESSDTPLFLNHEKNNISDNELVLLSPKTQSHKHPANDKTSDSIKSTTKFQSIPGIYRSYMRPPKNRITNFYRSSSSQFSDRSETSFNHSSNSSFSPSLPQQESNELPVHMPYERTLYDMKFEKDSQNDVRRKYNIPPPFQRKWLRQPRYVPQERPSVGLTKQLQDQ